MSGPPLWSYLGILQRGVEQEFGVLVSESLVDGLEGLDLVFNILLVLVVEVAGEEGRRKTRRKQRGEGGGSEEGRRRRKRRKRRKRRRRRIAWRSGEE
jgi:hypothetical protein